MRKIKALVLFSGGLDSSLAIKILQNQGIKVVTLSFKSYFFNGAKADKIVNFSEEHLKMVKNPEHGYGKTMNPCIDCHSLMLKKAKEIMRKENFDFVATGEVLGERPMSQNLKALQIVETQSSLKGYLLRPLSAKLLKPTIPEEKGIVDRDKLFDISGRSRKRQMELARLWQIKHYPTPAGGCLLTDPGFSQRLKELFDKYPEAQGNDIELLKFGRHFWEGKVKIIVGRNEEEDIKIKKLSRKKDILIEMKNYPGHLTLVRNYSRKKTPQKTIQKAKDFTQYYSTKARDKKGAEFNIEIQG